MLQLTPWTPVDEMSFPIGSSCQTGRMEDYIESVDHPHWAGVDSSPYTSASHPYTAAHLPSTVLTPISIADSSFLPTRASPGASHHSQEFQYPHIGEPVSRHGLGISSPFHGDFVESATPGFGLFHGPGIDYGSSQLIESPKPARSGKRARRASRNTQSTRLSPVRILPNPIGLQRLEQERRQGQATEVHPRESQRPRATGRGRRDPQAEEEDAYVENLRKQNLSWKVVAEMFRERFNKDSTEARLQMRMLRRRKSSAVWHEADIPLLLKAHEYWQREKYRIITQKLQELGATRMYTEQQCEAQLQALDMADNVEPPVVPPRIPDSQHQLRRSSFKASKRPRTSEEQ